MVEIQFLDFNFPCQAVHDTSVIDLYGQIPSLIKSSQFGVRRIGTRGKCRKFHWFRFSAHAGRSGSFRCCWHMLWFWDHRSAVASLPFQELFRTRFSSILTVGKGRDIDGMGRQVVMSTCTYLQGRDGWNEKDTKANVEDLVSFSTSLKIIINALYQLLYSSSRTLTCFSMLVVSKAEPVSLNTRCFGATFNVDDIS